MFSGDIDPSKNLSGPIGIAKYLDQNGTGVIFGELLDFFQWFLLS